MCPSRNERDIRGPSIANAPPIGINLSRMSFNIEINPEVKVVVLTVFGEQRVEVFVFAGAICERFSVNCVLLMTMEDRNFRIRRRCPR